MKRWLSGLLAALLLFSLAGCGGIVDLTEVPSESESARLEEQKTDLPAPDGEGSKTPEEAAPPELEEAAGPELPEENTQPEEAPAGLESDGQDEEPDVLPEDGAYTSKEDVALYIYTYGHLPDNFITKREAQDLGWPGGSLEPYAPGMCIGGSRFGNYEGLLPDAEGRRYTECDIDTLGANSRGAKRIVFSNDGLIYYTEDHYESFELLYGDEGDG